MAASKAPILGGPASFDREVREKLGTEWAALPADLQPHVHIACSGITRPASHILAQWLEANRARIASLTLWILRIPVGPTIAHRVVLGGSQAHPAPAGATSQLYPPIFTPSGTYATLF